MNKTKITSDLIAQTEEMIKDHSNCEIADKLRISLSTVKRIIKDNNFFRTREDKEFIRSRTRRALIRAERRRAIFGLDQKTEIKVFTNRERNSLKYCLRRRNYLFLQRGDNIAYFDARTQRHPTYEERGRKLGLKFKPIETQ